MSSSAEPELHADQSNCIGTCSFFTHGIPYACPGRSLFKNTPVFAAPQKT